MKHSLLILLILFILPACKDAGTSTSVNDDRLDISEAVFRHQFAHNASSQQRHAGVYFIAYTVRGDSVTPDRYRDVPAELMARFSGNAPRVKNAIACSVSVNGCYDKETGQLGGLLFRIDSIEMKMADEAEVKGGYFEAGLSASGNMYTVQRKQGRWVVVNDVMIWIS